MLLQTIPRHTPSNGFHRFVLPFCGKARQISKPLEASCQVEAVMKLRLANTRIDLAADLRMQHNTPAELRKMPLRIISGPKYLQHSAQQLERALVLWEHVTAWQNQLRESVQDPCCLQRFSREGLQMRACVLPGRAVASKYKTLQLQIQKNKIMLQHIHHGSRVRRRSHAPSVFAPAVAATCSQKRPMSSGRFPAPGARNTRRSAHTAQLRRWRQGSASSPNSSASWG